MLDDRNLTQAFIDLRPGELIKYRKGDLLVQFIRTAFVDGNWYVRVTEAHFQGHGLERMQRPEPYRVDQAFIAWAEGGLQRLGIDPGMYSLVPHLSVQQESI